MCTGLFLVMMCYDCLLSLIQGFKAPTFDCGLTGCVVSFCAADLARVAHRNVMRAKSARDAEKLLVQRGALTGAPLGQER